MRPMRNNRLRPRLRPNVWLVGVFAAGLLIAAAVAADPAQRQSEADDASSASMPPEPILGDESGFLHRVSHIRADVVRRSGGEWVIVNLALASVGAAAVTAPSGTASRIEDQPGLQAMLREYGRAFEEQDAQRLAAVWLMNPLEREEIDRLFAEMTSVDVSVSRPALRLQGRDRGSLEFDQHFVVSGLPPAGYSVRTAFRRALAAHDDYGDWSVDKVLEAR